MATSSDRERAIKLVAKRIIKAKEAAAELGLKIFVDGQFATLVEQVNPSTDTESIYETCADLGGGWASGQW